MRIGAAQKWASNKKHSLRCRRRGLDADTVGPAGDWRPPQDELGPTVLEGASRLEPIGSGHSSGLP